MGLKQFNSQLSAERSAGREGKGTGQLQRERSCVIFIRRQPDDGAHFSPTLPHLLERIGGEFKCQPVQHCVCVCVCVRALACCIWAC